MAKHINLPKYTDNADQILIWDADAKSIGDGIYIYQGIKAWRSGLMSFDEKGNGGKGTQRGVSQVAETFGFSQSTITKACSVVRVFIPNYATMTPDELTAATLSILAEFGSLSKAYEAANPSVKVNTGSRGPKSAAELLGAAARQAVAENMTEDEFLAAALAAYRKAEASQGE